MSLGILMLIAFILLLVGAIPGWSREQEGSGGELALAVFALPVLLFTGRL